MSVKTRETLMQRAMTGKPIMGQELRDLIDTMFWLKASPEQRIAQVVQQVAGRSTPSEAIFPDVPGTGFVKIGSDRKWFTDPTVYLTQPQGDSFYFRNALFPMDPLLYLAGDRTFKNFVDSARAAFTGGDGIDIVAGDIRVDNTVSRVGHIHDDRYYTETEVDTKLETRVKRHRFPINDDGTYNVVPSYSNANRQITLTPTGASFDVWINGTKHTFTGAQTLPQHSATSGVYFYYLDENGVFQVSTTSFELLKVAPVAIVIWNVAKGEGRWIHEFHTTRMSARTHERLHANGSVVPPGGFAMSGFTLNTNTPAAVSFGVAGGILWDEDIKHQIPALADGGPYEIWYRTGASGDWTWDSVSTLPYKYGATYFTVNQIVTGSWAQVEINAGSVDTWGNLFVVATPNNGGVSIICVQGQGIYTDALTAQAESWDAMDKGAFPFPEYFPLYRVTYKASVAYSGVTGRVRIEKVTSVAQGSESGVSGATVHNSLSGRDAIDAHPALSITDIYNLTNGVMLKKISTGIVAAAAADLPAHASRHHYGGSDALTGQSIGGLRVSDKPTFAGLISKVTGTASDIDFYSLAGYRQMSFRWSDTSQQLEVFSSNDTGGARANRMLIPRSSSSPVSILLGLTVTGTTTLDTSLSGMLKATAGVVSVASASDLPNHASRHHSGGADPLAGQSIAGLLTNSVPTFAGLNLKVSGTAADLNYQSLAGIRQMSVRWSDVSQQIEVFSSNDAGGSRSNRMLIPRADASPVQILLGLKITGTTTLDTGLTGMLKATSGVVSVAGASDLPAHASRHQWDGADPIQGQQLLGLRSHETPIFGGIQSGSVTGYLPIRGNTGVEIARFNSNGFISYGDITLSGDLSIANLSGILYAANGRVRVALGTDLPSHSHVSFDISDSGNAGRTVLQQDSIDDIRSYLQLTGWATKNFTNGSTTDIAEGTNLYYTDARARAAITASDPINVTNGHITHVNTDGYKHVPATGTASNGQWLRAGPLAGSAEWTTLLASHLPLHVHSVMDIGDSGTIGVQLMYAEIPAGARSILELTGWATKAFTNGSTTDVAEGTNLWFTTARAQAAISGLSPISVSSGVVSHADTDGYRHVPANGTTNSRLFLQASANPGLYLWRGIEEIDLPTHASRHHFGGSDQLSGQSISGLLVTSTPKFKGMNLQGTTLDDTYLRFYDNSGVLKHQLRRFSNANGGGLILLGPGLTDYRITVPSLSTLPIEIDGGLKIFSGDLTVNTSFNGLLKATAGVVSVVGAAGIDPGLVNVPYGRIPFGGSSGLTYSDKLRFNDPYTDLLWVDSDVDIRGTVYANDLQLPLDGSIVSYSAALIQFGDGISVPRVLFPNVATNKAFQVDGLATFAHISAYLLEGDVQADRDEIESNGTRTLPEATAAMVGKERRFCAGVGPSTYTVSVNTPASEVIRYRSRTTGLPLTATSLDMVDSATTFVCHAVGRWTAIGY